MQTKEQALQYEQLGFSVIPLLPKDKKPLVPWIAFQQKRALPEQILAWWDQHPQANLGIVTGQISGIFVLDVDGTQGQESLKGKHLPPTVTSRTGGGGIHYLYRYPGFEVKTCTNLLPKVDIRGDGGYIAAPPSIHPNGTAYEWAISPDDGEISQAPAWLLELLDDTRGPTEKEASMPNPVDVLQGVPQGERDDRLYQYACSLRARAVKKEEAEILILKAAGACSPPFPEKQALAKLDSAWKHPPGYGEEQDIYTAFETVQNITSDNVYDSKSIQALAMLYIEEPAEYAKTKASIKYQYKGKIDITEVEKAVKKEAVKQRKQEKQIALAVPGEEERFLSKLFPELELDNFLCPSGWILNPGGVFKPGESGCICVCSVPLIIAERLKNADTQNERITLQWKRDNRWQTCKADRAAVFNNMALIQLANKGLPVASSNE